MIRSRDDLHYFRQRAEEEIKRAELADHPDAVRAHSELAGYYLDLVHNGPAAQQPSFVIPGGNDRPNRRTDPRA